MKRFVIQRSKFIPTLVISALGIWAIFAGIVILVLLPLATTSPIGYEVAPLESIALRNNISETILDTIKEATLAEQVTAQDKEISKTSVVSEDMAIPKPDLVAKPAMALPTDSALSENPTATAKIGNSVGNLAPDFTLKRLDNEILTLSNLRGQKVLLNFWSTSCGACIVQFPVIREVYAQHGKNNGDLAVITICIDGTAEHIKKIEEKYSDKYGPLDFPILIADQEEIARKYGIWATPQTFFIDQSGIIQRVIIGRFETSEEIETILNSL